MGKALRFGRWKTRGPLLDHTHAKAACVCSCGTVKDVRVDHLRSGMSQSCGCLKIERVRTHGQSGTSTYGIWSGMHGRCNTPHNDAFKYYGGRGIKVCARWSGRSGFANFLADMGERPPGLSVERIDNGGNYTPRNCRWASPAEQTLNTRRNVLLTFQGETLPRAVWAKRLGMKSNMIKGRLARGWSVKRALSTPPQKTWTLWRPARRNK